MKRYLILKLLVINLVVIGFVMILVWFAIDTLAAGYFVTLMEKYNISPKPAHAMFVGAIHRYLLWTSLAAVILAVILSYLMMRKVLAPLTQMNAIRLRSDSDINPIIDNQGDTCFSTQPLHLLCHLDHLAG